jgi:hypothetical protein
MNLLGEHRLHMEEKELIEHALLLLEERHVSFWKTGIKLGNDLIGLTLKMPQGGPRDIKRVRMKPVNMQNSPKYITPKYSVKRDEYRKQKNENTSNLLSVIDPFYAAHADYLEITGQSITPSSEITAAFVDRLNGSSNNTFGHTHPKTEAHTETIDNNEDDCNEDVEEQLSKGVHLLFSSKRMCFYIPINQVTTSVITIHNRGTISVHFQWEKVKRANSINVFKYQRQVPSVYDDIQRFYFSHKTGVILPGTAYDFPVIFKSSSHGVLFL